MCNSRKGLELDPCPLSGPQVVLLSCPQPFSWQERKAPLPLPEAL